MKAGTVSLETKDEPQVSLAKMEPHAQGYKEEHTPFWSQIYLGLETSVKI